MIVGAQLSGWSNILLRVLPLMWAVFGYAYDAEAIATMPPAACSSRAAFLTAYKFTSKERDAESGLDMFGARYYGSSLGRFMTPDWATARPMQRGQ
jgi:RHS repeat-associated protein